MPHNKINTNKYLKEFLDEKTELYNNPSFIASDPISIPHRYTLKQDIEIAAFFVSSIAWGNRLSIIKSGDKLMRIMGNNPTDYILYARKNHINKLNQFVHRTFNAVDAEQYVYALRKVYKKFNTLEEVFNRGNNTYERLIYFNTFFTSSFKHKRTAKHISNPQKGSAAKRLNMFLRWMVRKDNAGVDFGIWNSIKPCELYLPLDVHTGNIARKLGLLKRRQNDWKALEELMLVLKQFDADDPVKYDFALFGLGAFEKF